MMNRDFGVHGSSWSGSPRNDRGSARWLERSAGSTMGAPARRSRSKSSLLETLEPRMLLAGDHSSFSDFPNTDPNTDIVVLDGGSGEGFLLGTIEPLGGQITERNDLFQFTALADDFVTIKADATNTANPSVLNSKIRIFTANSQGQPVLVGQSSGDGVLTAGTPTDAWFGFVATEGTTYYVVVESDVTSGSAATGDYILRVDARTMDTVVDATGVVQLVGKGENEPVFGSIEQPGRDTVYKVVTPGGSFFDSLITINATAASNNPDARLDTHLDIYNASGGPIDFDVELGRRNDAYATLKGNPDVVYYVRVRSDEFLLSRVDEATGEYFLAMDLGADEFVTPIDPVLRRVSDTLGAIDEEAGFQTRIYKFIAQGTGRLIVTAIPRFAFPPAPVFNPALWAYDAAGTRLAFNDDFFGAVPQIEIDVVGGRQYEIIVDNFIGDPNQHDYSMFVEAHHTFDPTQPVDDHPTTPAFGTAVVPTVREFRAATPLVWGAPFLLTDAADLPIQDVGWLTDAWGTGRVYGSGDTDLFQFTPPLDMLGDYEGDNDDAGTALYVGGQFLHAGTINGSIENTSNRIAAYDANDWWNARRGLNGTVRAMVAYDHDGDEVPSLIVGGDFTLASNTSNPDDDLVVNGLARWTYIPLIGDYEWRAFGTGVTKVGGVASVRAMTIWDPDAYGSSPDLPPTLVIGGDFTTLNGVARPNLGMYDPFLGFQNFEGVLPVTAPAGARVNALASYIQDPPDPDGPGPLDDPEPLLYLAVGGTFTNGVVEWGPNRPTVPGAPQFREVRLMGGGVVGQVNALVGFDPPDPDGQGTEPDPAGVLIVGGTFTNRGNRIADWDGVSWGPLGTGLNNTVNALVAWDGDDPDGAGPAPNPPNVVIAGGTFTSAGGLPADRVAQFFYAPIGPAWAALGNPFGPPGFDGTVNALTVMSDIDIGLGNPSQTGPVVYAGGAFRNADGAAANRVAKLLWNPFIGAYVWNRMGNNGPGANNVPTGQPFLTDNGVSDTVFALAEFDDGNPNLWDRHDTPSARLNIVVRPTFGPNINTAIRVFDSSMNLIAENGIYTNNNLDQSPWATLLPDASTFPFDTSRSGMIDPSLALPGSVLDGITGIEVWGGETYYIEVSGISTGRYNVRVTAHAYVPDGPNNDLFDPTVDGDFFNAFQLASPVDTGDARNFIDPVPFGMYLQSFQTTGTGITIANLGELGIIHSIDETDFFKFRAQESGYAEVRINTTQIGDEFREFRNGINTSTKTKAYDSSLDSTLRVYRADFEQIAYSDSNGTVTGEPSIATPVGTFGNRVFHKRDARVIFHVDEGEEYYIAVGSGQRWVDGSLPDPADRVLRTDFDPSDGESDIDWRHATGGYELLVNSMSDLDLPPDDHSFGFTLATPILISADPAVPATNGRATIDGRVESTQDTDDFFFLAPARGTATLKIRRQTGSTVVPVVQVFDSQNQQVAGGAASSNGALTLTFPVTPGERFNIRVFGLGTPTGGYIIELSGMPYADDFVDATDLSNATPIPQLDFQGNGTVLGSIEQPGDTDIFKFTTDDFAVMTLSVTTFSPTFDPYITVYEVSLDAGGNNFRDPVSHPILMRIAYNDNAGATGVNASVSFSATPDRTTVLTGQVYPWYYVVVSGADPSTDYGAYTLRLDFPPTDDHPDAGEYAFAHTIDLDSQTGSGASAGITETLEDSDLFRFVAPAGGEAGVQVTRPPGSAIVPKVTVYELVGGTPIVRATGTASEPPGGFEAADTGLFTVTRGSTYFVLVENTGGTFGAYTVSVTAPPVDDYPNIGEFGIAAEIDLSPFTGDGSIGGDSPGDPGNPRLSPVNDTDLFTFIATGTGPGTITLTSYSSGIGRFGPRLRIFDSSQSLIAEDSNDIMPTADEPSVVSIDVDDLVQGQTYYVLVSAVDNLPPPATLTGEYKIFVDTFVPDDGGGGDPGAIDFNNPSDITLDIRTGAGARSDIIGVPGDRDLFRFTLPDDASGPAFVQVVTPNGSVLDCTVTVLNAPNEAAVVTEDSVGIPGATANAAFSGVGGETYWVIVEGLGSGVGAYTIRVKTQPTTQYLYFPEGFASIAIREFVSISNNNAYPVNVTIWAYYEDPDLGGPLTAPAPTRLTSIFAGGSMTFAPGERNGITTSNAGLDYDADPGNDSEGRRAGLIFDLPYALVIESTGPVGATIAHYDFGATVGDTFTDKTSATWTFARVEKNSGAVEDFVLYYNPNPFKVRVSATAYTAGGQAIQLPDRDLNQNERAGLAIDKIPNVPAGIVSVKVTATVHPDEDLQPSFLGIVASLTHYDKGAQSGFGLTGDHAGGSVAGAITSLTNGDTVGGELTFFNPGDTPAVVNLVGSYVIADLPDLVRILNVPARSVLVLRGDEMNFVRNQPIGLHWVSSEPITVQSVQTQNGEADASAAALEAGQAFFFGDGFMNTVYAGQLYFETLSFYNPTSTDTTVQVKLLFTGVNDFIIANVPVGAHGFAQLKLHELPDLLNRGSVLNFYSIQASAAVPFVATLTHYDLYLRGGFTTAGAPLGLLNGLSTIPA